MRRIAHSSVDPLSAPESLSRPLSCEPALEPPRPERLVFVVGAIEYRRRHLVAAARALGEWDALVRAAREELACAARAAELGDPLDPVEVESAAAGFRRARGLLAAEDLRTWLSERDLTACDWLAHLRGTLLQKRWEDELGAIAGRAERYAAAELGRAVWTLWICTGACGELAERLAVGAAAEAALARAGEPAGPSAREPDVGPVALEAARAAAERLVEEAATSGRIAREIETHRVGWTSVDALLVVHPDLDVLHEVALCVSEDGRQLEEVAREAGAELRRSRLVLGELPPELEARLLAAQPGELLEPEPVGEAGWIVLVEAKTTPSPADPELRGRARELIGARERARLLDDRVRWHERL